MNIEIKPVTSAQLPAYAQLVHQLIGETLPYYNSTYIAEEQGKFDQDHLQEKLESEDSILLAAFDDDQVVGFYILDIDNTVLNIFWYGVRPSHRKQGIMKLMHNWAENYAREHKMNKIYCETRTNNLESNVSLMKNDFIITATLKNSWHRLDYYMWEKEIEIIKS